MPAEPRPRADGWLPAATGGTSPWTDGTAAAHATLAVNGTPASPAAGTSSPPRVSPALVAVLAVLAVALLGARSGGVPAIWREWRLPGSAAAVLQPARAAPAPPAVLDVPAIGVHADVIRVGLTSSGALDTPPPALVGWYDATPHPGARGSSVLAGHVDTWNAPAVFARLAEVKPGHLVGVRGEDGWTTVFEVRAITRHPKDDLPASFWQPDRRRLLRLITCGGRFDSARRSYRDNLVVHAVALGSWRSADPGAAMPWSHVSELRGAGA